MLFIIICSLSCDLAVGQKTYIEQDWVRILETDYEKVIRAQPEINEADYLKLSIRQDGTMRFYSNYAANGLAIPFNIENGILTYGFNRKFKIEQQSSDRLVMVELFDGKITRSTKRHYFIRETLFLDRLPYPADDLVVIGNDTAFIASRKLYPVFRTTDTPDFHIFIHNQIRNSYRTGENYFHATFMIRPDGSIDHVELHHRIGKASDKKAMKAILSSAGRWDMPLLNGKEVNVLMTIEDLFNRHTTSSLDKPLDLAPTDASEEAPEVYMRFFNLAIRSMLRGQYQKALESLQFCEDRKPEDPNLPYLRYLIYTNLNDKVSAEAQLTLVKKSRLKYLVK